MSKRIFKTICLCALLGLLGTALIFTFSFYRYISNNAQGSLQNVRITITQIDGEVIFDNKGDINKLDNHKDRPEISQAITEGSGFSRRFSDTEQRNIYYYALRLENDTVLRLAITENYIKSILAHIVSIMALTAAAMAILCTFIANRLAKNIVEPINKIDFSNLKNPEQKIYDELAPFITKINTQKRQIEEQLISLDRTATIIRTITENMREGIIMVDRNSYIITANNSLHAIFGKDQDFSGKSLLELTRNLNIIHGIDKALSGQTNDIICNLPTQESDKCYNVFFEPVADGGVIALFMDVTAKMASEKMRREFSANVSHELKTPLTAISGYAEMIGSGMAATTDVPEFAQKISNESNRLLALIQDIIKLSQLDELEPNMDFTKFNLKDMALEIANDLDMVAAEKNVTITVTGSDIDFFGNQNMIHEVLYNLLDNAIKYNKQDGTVNVDISCYQQNNAEKIKLIVKDSGIGIPENHLNRIFERFYRIDKSRSKKTGGTGLGLSIVKHIVQYHKGTINIQSKPNNGTEITITL